MSDYSREFVFLRAELALYENCSPRACNDAVAFVLWWRVKTRAEHLISAGMS